MPWMGAGVYVPPLVFAADFRAAVFAAGFVLFFAAGLAACFFAVDFFVFFMGRTVYQIAPG
jgi:hypothetical protein